MDPLYTQDDGELEYRIQELQAQRARAEELFLGYSDSLGDDDDDDEL